MNEETLFELARNTPHSERVALFDQHCAGNPALRARVEALLQADAQTLGYAIPADSLATKSHHEPMGEPGQLVGGKYKLLDNIGEGGMGSVWRAQQSEPVKRLVAVKLIKAGMDSKAVLARFEAERQALAVMDHPNIAKILDGGLHENRPYFVMELVKGVPITAYCDAHKLTPKERLELFVPVCQAIQHAHQKGIIHRDIKPSNVMVAMYDDKPVVKVIDFGVAKATGGGLTDASNLTAFGGVVGTPQYMSPEQASLNNLDIDTRSDVYSLGALLYELLAGSPPFSGKELRKLGFLEILRVVREEEPPKPSTKLSTADELPSLSAKRGTEPKKLTGLLRNELDWIVLKALEKDRTRRYETAIGFAADIQRYLSGEAVQAHPPSTTYRIEKFLRRNRGPVIVTGLVFTTLVAGIVGTGLGLMEAKKQETFARTEAAGKEKARRETREALDTLTSDALEGWFTREMDLSGEQKDVLRKLLDRYAKFAEESGDDADARKGQVRALMRVGRIQRALGQRSAATSTFDRAAVLAGSVETPITPDVDGWELVATAQNELARLVEWDYVVTSPYEHYRTALTAQRRARDADPTSKSARFRVTAFRVSLSGALADGGKFSESEAQSKVVLAEMKRLIEEFPEEPLLRENLAVHLYNRGRVEEKRGNYDAALVLNLQALELQRRAVAERPNQVRSLTRLVMGLRHRSDLLDRVGRLAELESVRREALQVGLKLGRAFPSMPEYRVHTTMDYVSLAHALSAQAKHSDAINEIARALDVIRRLVLEFPDDATTRVALIRTLTVANECWTPLRKLKEAEGAVREALAEIDRLMAQDENSDDLQLLRIWAFRGLEITLRNGGQVVESNIVGQKRLAVLARFVQDHPERGDYLRQLIEGRLDIVANRLQERDAEGSLARLREVAEDIRRLPVDERGRWTSAAFHYTAKTHVLSGKWSDADRVASQAVDAYVTRLKKNPESSENRGFLTQAYWNRAIAREKLNHEAEAIADWSAAMELADDPMDRNFYRAHRATAIAAGGDGKLAGQEFTATLQLTEKLVMTDGVAGVTLYDAAAVYALAAQATKEAAVKQKLALESIRLLRMAAATGFLNEPSQLVALNSAEDYEVLRNIDDFKTLITELEKKFPPPRPKVMSPAEPKK
jgi:serine/threonine protein kinase